MNASRQRYIAPDHYLFTLSHAAPPAYHMIMMVLVMVSAVVVMMVRVWVLVVMMVKVWIGEGYLDLMMSDDDV